MDVTEIYLRLTDILREIFDDDTLTAVPTMIAKDVDGWDSLNNIRVILSVEREFGIKFSASEIAKFNNVGELASLTQSKVNHKPG